MLNEINRISENLGKIALDVNVGKLKNVSTSMLTKKFDVEVFKKPQSEWAKKVDDIESPFVAEYDESEYKNASLNLMGLYEMKSMLKAFGVNSTDQTKYSKKPLRNKNYFVVGTGTGREVINLAGLGGNVIGIDATKGYVELTAKKLESISSELDPNQNIRLIQCPAENYPYKANTIDGMSILFGVPNHINGFKSLLKKIGIAIKGDGKLVVEKYGSNDALVFKLKKTGELKYAPSILQRRDPNGKGILLGDSEKVLPANFPNDPQFRNQIVDSGFEIQKRIGFLRIAALFPKDPTPENLKKFLELVSRIDKKAYDFLYQFNTNESLLLGSFMYDLQSQRRKKNPVNIEDFAYVLYVGRKKKPEEYLRMISR